jgi:hypothetical protein
MFMEYAKSRMSSEARRSAFITVAATCVVILSTPVSAGITYGIYDARTLGMGGAAVASANNDNAQFYNAALLAFNDEIEERTRDSRFLFPLLIPQASDSAITIEKLAQDDPGPAITLAIAAFNSDPNFGSAQAIVDATANLDASLSDIDGEDLSADIYIGLAVSEPGKFHGAGFFIGTRLLAGGQSVVSDSDRAVLAAYQEGLTFVASGGAQGSAHPELFDANGALINPGNDFNSTANAAGAAITEAGVAMSRQIRPFGETIAAGFSFKVMRIDTFEDAGRVVDGRIDTDRNNDYFGNVNFDIGLVKEVGKRWRIGLAVKDVIPHNYNTSLGTAIRLRPRARIGVAYQAGRLQLAADTDLTRNESLGGERPTQELAVGAEWVFGAPIKMRAGYRHDVLGVRDGIVSLGLGTVWKRLAVDFAYAGGSDARAAALQFGIVF